MSKDRILIIAIFTVSLGLRLTLCIINRGANDDHLEVINRIVDKHEIPNKEDCWECFQPKLFYLIHAGIINLLHIENPVHRRICVQLINFIFSFFLLVFLWKFIARQNFSPHIRVSCFALVALNPCLTGINVQATNDTLEILAGVLVIYFADLFFTEKKISTGILMVVFTILASLVKSSGIVILVALVMIFVLKLISSRPENRRHLGTVFLILLFSYFAIVPFAGDYYRNYQKYKTPFVHNHPHKDPPPDFFKRTYIQRPGITSVMDGYFTFRYFDMIREPMITNGDENYPLHRTSLWSQLYGRTFFMHFDQWPPSWVSSDPNIRMAGRVLIILGIFPLLLFMAGFLKSIYRFFMSVKNNRKYYLSSGNDWMYLVFLSGFLLFIMKYTYDYRDFSTMKSIFIFPALPAFIKFYLNGFSLINSGLLIRLLHFITGAIVIFSLYDIGFLIGQL